MKEQLESLQNEALDSISKTQDLKKLQEIKVSFVGKKGSLTSVLRGMGKLSKEERPIVGEVANRVRSSITAAIEQKNEELEAKAIEKQLEDEAIDVTLPGRPVQVGGKHVLTKLIEEIEDLFIGMGFEVQEGPEVETEFFNFDALKDRKSTRLKSSHVLISYAVLYWRKKNNTMARSRNTNTSK